MLSRKLAMTGLSEACAIFGGKIPSPPHIRVWGPSSFDPSKVFRPFNVLRDGGVMRTSEVADLIEVDVIPEYDKTKKNVSFELKTPNTVRWRKEIVIETSSAHGSLSKIAWTQDDTHLGKIDMLASQLPGATISFRKQKFLGGMKNVHTIGGLNAISPGDLITFVWAKD